MDADTAREDPVAAWVVEHHGQLSAMAADVAGMKRLGLSDHEITPQGLRKKLGPELVEFAAKQRQGARIRGPRTGLEPGEVADPVGEGAAVRAALEGAQWDIDMAAAQLGMSRRTLYRRMEALGIERPGWDREALLRELQAHGYSVNALAKTLGYTHQTLQYHLDKFEIDRAEVNKMRLAARALAKRPTK